MTIARTSKWVINPEQSSFLQTWDKITLGALAFVAIVTPVQVAMMETRIDPLFFINILVDMVFLIEMLLQFFLMYPMRTDCGHVLEHRHPHIVKRYVKTWFLVDLFSILPFDLVGLLMQQNENPEFRQLKAVKVVRLMRILKLVRMVKASRVFRRIEVRMSVTYQRLALLKFFTMLMLITHWMANLWAMTLFLVEESEGLPRWVDALTEMESNVEIKTKDSFWKLYIACAYFTSYTITSVGYGDIGPKNILERIVCTLMIFVSGISWALVLAQVTGIVGHMDAEDQNFRKVMDELNFFMEDRKLNMEMRHRLRSFFLSNKSVRRREHQQWVLERMSPALKGEVFMEMNKLWMRRVGFLQDIMSQSEHHTCSRLRDFLVGIAQILLTEVHAQAEVFGRPRSAYILTRGIVARSSRVLRQGATWGYDSFILSDGSKDLLEPIKSFSLTYVELLVLDRILFSNLSVKHRHICPVITRTLRRHGAWLAFQRTMWAEAYRRMGPGVRRRRPSLTSMLS